MALSLDEALGMSLLDEADESIHVDVNTRQITIPESQQLFGVESDTDVEIKHIVIDGRYADGTDLSGFTFRVNYQNANGDKGTYLVTALKVNDDSIEFDWIIGRQVVAYKGTIAFIVCAYTIDSDSVIQNEWNSTLGKGTVLEGLEVSEVDFADDIVRQLAGILNDVNVAQASAKASAEEAYKSKTEVVALGKEQQAAIEKKGKETLSTIPEDYTQVSNDVSQLKEDTTALKDGKISKFYASSQGETTLPDSDNGRLVDLLLYGKSSQQQYRGLNLLNPTLATTTSNGVTCTANGDGTYTFNGTATANADFKVVDSNFSLSDGGKYKITGCPSGGGDGKYRLLVQNTAYTVSGTDYGDGATITADDNPYYVYIRIYKGASVSNLVFKPMLTTDLTATYAGYEPYVGGIPSPSPEYPQEIKSVVNPTIKVCGKNLAKNIVWNISSKAGITVEKISETTFKITGTATDDTYTDSWNQTIDVPVGGALFCEVLQGKATSSGQAILYSGGYKNAIYTNFDGTQKNKTATTFTGICFRLAFKKGDVLDCVLGVSVQMGGDASYQPYIETVATLPYTLNAIPVSSGGNVTIDGQQYIADYVDVERGKLMRMVAGGRLYGTGHGFTWRTSQSGADLYASSHPYIDEFVKDEASVLAISNAFCSGGVWSWNSKNAIGVSNGDRAYIFIGASSFESTSALAAYLDANEVYIYSRRREPLEIDLTADEIAAFKALASYYPTTNVACTSDELDGHVIFDYPISLANGWDYIKQQLGDTRDYVYGLDLMTAEAYVNSEYASAIAELEVV